MKGKQLSANRLQACFKFFHSEAERNLGKEIEKQKTSLINHIN